MWYFIISLIVLVSILLVLIVLVQNPKGGGLASGFSGANQFGGVAQTNEFLAKTTWRFALIILGLSIGSVFFLPKEEVNNQPDMTEIINNTDFNSAPINPVQINPGEDE